MTVGLDRVLEGLVIQEDYWGLDCGHCVDSRPLRGAIVGLSRLFEGLVSKVNCYVELTTFSIDLLRD